MVFFREIEFWGFYIFVHVILISLLEVTIVYNLFNYQLLLLFLRINVDLAIFQLYLDLEAGDNQSLKIQVARPGIEPRSSCSSSQGLILNCYT